MLAVVFFACASPHRAAPDVSARKSRFPVREWSKLPEDRKLAIITGAIQFARRDGTEIRLPATYYVAQIDALSRAYASAGNEEGLDSSVGATFRTIAIMEGDWDDDEGKVEQARRLLGPDLFEHFKVHYPEKYRRLVEIDARTGAAAGSKPTEPRSDGAP